MLLKYTGKKSVHDAMFPQNAKVSEKFQNHIQEFSHVRLYIIEDTIYDIFND